MGLFIKKKKKKEILKQGLYQHYGLYPGSSWHIQQIIP